MPRLKQENVLKDEEKTVMALVASDLWRQCDDQGISMYKIADEAGASDTSIRSLMDGKLKSRPKAEAILDAMERYAGEEWRLVFDDLMEPAPPSQPPASSGSGEEAWEAFVTSLNDRQRQLIVELAVTFASKSATVAQDIASDRQPRSPLKPRRTILGEWLTACREKKGLRQNQVAAFLDVNQGRITEWEQGTRLPSPEQLRQMSAYYGEALPKL